MSLFSAILPTFLNKTGEWVENLGDGVERQMNQPKTGVLEFLKKPIQKITSLFKKEPQMTFEVGAGFTPEQKIKAEEVVRKVPEVPIQPTLKEQITEKPMMDILTAGKYLKEEGERGEIARQTIERMTFAAPIGEIKQVGGILKKAIPQMSSLISAGKSLEEISLPSQRTSAELFTRLKVEDSLSKISAIKMPFTEETLKISPSRSMNFGKVVSVINKDISPLISLYHRTKDNVKPFLDILENISQNRKVAIDIKRPTSIVEKIIRNRDIGIKDYWFNDVRDTLRGTIIIKDQSEIPTIINQLKGKIIGSPDNYFLKPTELGYKGFHLNVGLPDGQIAEIQLHTPISKLTANKITDIYQQWRGKDIPKSVYQKSREIVDKIYKQEIKEVKPKGFDWKERGFVTSVKEELPELKVAGQYVPRSTDRLAMKAKTLIKEDLKTAEKMAQGTDDNAVAVGSELLKHYSDEAAKATDEVVKDALYSKAGNLANQMARNLTEQGRTVQAASILGRLTPEGQLRFAAREIQKYNEVVEKTRGGLLGLRKKVPELTDKQVADISTEMKTIQIMPEGTEKAMRFQKLQNYISDLVPSSLFKKVIAVWKAGLLTGLKTSGLNIFANVSHFGTEIIKDAPATMVDKIASWITGKRTVAITLKRIPTGAREGLQKGWRYLSTGFDERNIGVKLDYKRINFGKGKLAKGLQTYTDTVFKIIGSEDQPFYYAAKVRSLYEQAKVGAINKGLKGQDAQKFIDDLIQNPTDEMIKYASMDAEIAVFQNKTALGAAAKKIQETGVGEVIVPFGRTPSAVATQIINYSPIGLIKTIFENIGKGRFDQRIFSKGIGRGLTGTGALALGALLFRKGMMTLARPKGEKEQKLWELEGKTANALYDPITKKWRTIQVLGPVGNVFLIGGHFQNAFDNSGSPTEAMTTALAGASQSFSQQTFLTGVSNFIDAVSDPARSAEYVAGSTLASTIPTIVADIGRATDTKERRANEIFEKFQARIPGVRETLEPQITVLGEEKETIGNPLEIMADPTRPSPEKITPVIQELRRLWDTGFKVSPTLLGDKKGYDVLTDEQNTELWKRAGEITNSKLDSLIKNQIYQQLPDDLKAKKVEEITDKSKLIARVEMVLKLTEGLTGEGLLRRLKELKESDLMTREVFNEFQRLR